ncbi:MAG: hypothetical protein EOO68_32900 [Moraxellaceae bacterium]|nr:MAG: hypothetical protein EOO68_32900 [Moraxellaceae bacterium]
MKAQITNVVRNEKIQALLAKQASELVSAPNSGKAIADQAKDAGLEVKTVAAISRGDRETDREVLQYAFTMPAPVGEKATAGSVRTANGDYVVVSLAAVHLAGEDKVPAEQRASISTQLANINGSYELKSFQSHLEEVAKIKRK